jgi:site-specific DNA recombinase
MGRRLLEQQLTSRQNSPPRGTLRDVARRRRSNGNGDTSSSPARARRGRAAGYLRVSTARDDMKADAIYRDQIRRHVRAGDLRLVKLYEDIGWSGREGSKRRPQFEAMLDAAGAGSFDTLIVPKLSRFGRSLRENVQAYDRLARAGCSIVFLDLGVDTSTSTGKLLRNIFTSLAEWESDLISDRWKDTHSFLARRGRPSGSVPFGYGYDAEAKEQRPREPEASVVREIFTRYANGEGIRPIARDLERRGVRGMRGATRWAPTIGYVLDNMTYVGVRLWQDEEIPGTWEPIIDRGLWDRVQALRQATVDRPAFRTGTPRALLSGLLRCGRCGEPMWHVGDRYRCSTFMRRRGCASNAVKAAKAERLAGEAFLGHLSEPHRRRAAAKGKALVAGRQSENAAAALRREIGDVDRQIESLVAKAAESPGPAFEAAFRRRATELEDRRAELEAQAARLAVDAEQEERRRGALRELQAQLADLPAVWEKATMGQRRDMLSLAMAEIRVVREGVKSLEITWHPWAEAL